MMLFRFAFAPRFRLISRRCRFTRLFLRLLATPLATLAVF